MATPAETLAQSLAKLRTATRFKSTSSGYRKDNPAEYAKVIAYLDGGARPSGVTSDMGLHALLEEDARRALGVAPPPPPPPPPSSSHPYTGFWTRPIPASPAIDSNSASIIPFWAGYAIVNPNLCKGNYGVAVVRSSPSDTSYTVAIVPGSRAHRLDNPIRIPAGVIVPTGTDHHVSIVDSANNRIHDLWYAIYTTGSWTMGGGMSTTIGTNGDIGNIEQLGYDFWGGNAAKTPNMAGLVTPEEIAAGRIDHVLQFMNPSIGQGASRYPARTNVPTAPNSDSRYIVEGTWLQLDPAYNVDGQSWSAWVKVVAKAMQKYGMVCRDNSGSFAILGENTDNRGGAAVWTAAGVSSVYFPAGFPWGSMRVLSPPTP